MVTLKERYDSLSGTKREDAQLVMDEMNERHPSRFASKPHPSTMIEIENRLLKESMKVEAFN